MNEANCPQFERLLEIWGHKSSTNPPFLSQSNPPEVYTNQNDLPGNGYIGLGGVGYVGQMGAPGACYGLGLPQLRAAADAPIPTANDEMDQHQTNIREPSPGISPETMAELEKAFPELRSGVIGENSDTRDVFVGVDEDGTEVFDLTTVNAQGKRPAGQQLGIVPGFVRLIFN